MKHKTFIMQIETGLLDDEENRMFRNTDTNEMFYRFTLQFEIIKIILQYRFLIRCCDILQQAL